MEQVTNNPAVSSKSNLYPMSEFFKGIVQFTYGREYLL